MKANVTTNKCDECGTCISVCPENALHLTNNLIVDKHKCIGCSKCVKVCPVSALALQDK